MNHSAPVVPQHDEDVQDTKCDCGHVIGQERPPGLRRRFPSTDHVLGHGPFGDVVAQQSQFGYDPWCAPGRVLPGHPSDEVADFTFDARAAGFAGLGFPAPVPPESLPVPLDDGFGLDDGQCGSPVRPNSGEQHPEEAVAWSKLRAFDGMFVDGHLLPQGEVLGGQTGLRSEHRSQKQQTRLPEPHSRALSHRGNPQL